MLCPEVWTFPPPKTFISQNRNEDIKAIQNCLHRNSFYKSVIITCPDELQIPIEIEDILKEDSQYYKITGCSLLELIEPDFTENFVKKGKLYCLTTNRNCMVENCAAITPDGVLTLHIADFIYQSLGLDGTKRPHNYYELKIDLIHQKKLDKLKQALSKIECFDFLMIWEPHAVDICPSSIAKYFCERNISVSMESLEMKRIAPTISAVPSVKDVDIDEMVEWTGLLAHNADVTTDTENYISTYSQPDSKFALKSTRMSILIVKGFLLPSLISNVCDSLKSYTLSRALENYWTAISVQSQEHSLWQWNASSPKMFQAHDNSYTIFFTHEGQMVYSIGQLKYS